MRQALVEATRRLVEERGPERVSVSEASRAAGVSTAAPYRHFTDRQDMLKAVALDGIERLRTRLQAAGQGCAAGSIARIAACGAAYIAFAEAEPGVFRLMFALTEEHDDHAELRMAGQACYEVLLHDVAAYLRRDGIDEELMQISFPLWTLVHGTAFLLIDRKVRVMELAPDLTAMLARSAERLLGPRPPG